MIENVQFGNDAFSVALVPNTNNENAETALLGSSPPGATITPGDQFVITVENLSPQVRLYRHGFNML